MIGLTGVTGQVGRRLAERLSEGERGALRLIARDVTKVEASPGAEVVAFGGYDDEAGMRSAFEGVDTLFLVSAHEAEDRVAQHKRAVDAAVAAGVGRIVYLSLLGAAPDATFTLARDHFHTEEHIRRSGAAFTFSRQSLYMDVLPYFGGEDGVIRGPAGDGRIAAVHRDDVADALHAMLTQSGHDGATYTLTGPEAFTLSELAARLSEHLGKPFSFVNETIEEAYESRAHYGAPAFEVDAWVSTYTAIAVGEFDVVSGDVERLTGHPPLSLTEFLRTAGGGAI